MKSIQRTDTLRNRRALGDGVQEVYAAEKGGMRKIRCPSCGSALAVPSTAAGGQPILQCGCGAKFSSRPM